MALTITKDNFEAEVLQSEKPVLVDFWASWCGPCRMLSPVIDGLDKKYEGKVVIGKVNVDEERELAKKYRVFSIPTLVVIKGGQVVNKAVGVQSKEEILQMLRPYFRNLDF